GWVPSTDRSAVGGSRGDDVVLLAARRHSPRPRGERGSDLPRRAGDRLEELPAFGDASFAGRTTVRGRVRGAEGGRQRAPFHPGEEPLRRRADEDVPPPTGSGAGPAGDALSGIPQEDPRLVRAAGSLQERLC